MTVKELIELLEKVPNKNDIVMFDPKGGFKNEGIEGRDGIHFSIDDVLLCHGSMKGFVLLTEDELKDGDPCGPDDQHG